MKVIIGIGNPEPEYSDTRHNVGKMVVEWLGDAAGFTLVKSTSFMNESGLFVRRYLEKHDLDPADLVIVHDDWAFGVGQFKLQINRDHNNHNGVKSIIAALGTKSFWRLRVGIGLDNSYPEPADYVLSKFNRQEIRDIKAQIPQIRERLLSIANSSLNNV